MGPESSGRDARWRGPIVATRSPFRTTTPESIMSEWHSDSLTLIRF